MRRLFLPGELSDTVTLTGSDAHHVGYTLRARRGDRFIVVGAERQTAAMEITAFTKDTVMLRRVANLDADTEPPIELGLAICLLKGDKLDFAVQKAVELGAAFIQPLRSENCVVRYDAKKTAAREEKWRRVAAEAAKQCGRTLVPRVEPVGALAAWLKELPADSAVFMAYERNEPFLYRAHRPRGRLYARRSGGGAHGRRPFGDAWAADIAGGNGGAGGSHGGDVRKRGLGNGVTKWRRWRS